QLWVARHLQGRRAPRLFDLRSGCYLPVQLRDFVQQRRQIDFLRTEVKAAAAIEQARGIEEIVDQVGYPQHRSTNFAGALVNFVRRRAIFQLDQALRVAVYYGQWRAELM